jgi:hypothetical protein
MWGTVDKEGTITDILTKRYKYMELVDLAVVEKVVYAVMRGIRDGQRRKSCFIFQLLDDDGKLAVGDYHESQNPSFDRCPKQILEQLDDTSISESKAWRTKCWANLDYAPKQLAHGAVVKFAEPIQFADGRVLDTFVYETEGRSTYFVDGDISYKVPGWKKRQYAVVG